MQSWVLELLAQASGMSPQQLNEVLNALPATKQTVDLLAKLEPIIEKAEPIIFDELMPLYQEAKPTLVQLLQEWKTVGPALQVVMGFVVKQMADGKSMSQATDVITRMLPQ